MFNSNKKTELVKKESLTLSLVQFCAKLWFKKEMYFSQISIKRNEHRSNPDLMTYVVNGYVFYSDKSSLDFDPLGVMQEEFAGFIEISKNKQLYLVNKVVLFFKKENGNADFYWSSDKKWDLWEDNKIFNDFIKKIENVL